MKDFWVARHVYKDEVGGELLAHGGTFRGKVVELQPSSGACKTGKNLYSFTSTILQSNLSICLGILQNVFWGDEEFLKYCMIKFNLKLVFLLF